MTTKDEAMKLALEALEMWTWVDTPPTQAREAIAALRQAIEQAEQAQPVAWRTEVKHGRLYFHIGVQSFAIDYHPEDEPEWSAGNAMAWMEKRLHEALSNLAPPPRQPEQAEQAQPVATWENKYGMKEWQVHALRAGWSITPPPRQPLTDEEICAVWEKAAVQDNGHHARLDNQPFVHFARAIEAAHGIKGEA